MRNKTTIRIAAIIGILLFLVFILVTNWPKPSPDNPTVRPKKVKIQAPAFSSDSAYNFIQKQVDFGPRVPNTPEAVACGDWLVEKFKSYGMNVIEQTGVVDAYDGTKLNMRNIIAEFKPEVSKRILLFAHWDTRPFADKDTVRIKEPILGANDGGSGVGVLLEVARILQQTPTDYGIDIILFDTEDYGTPNFAETSGSSRDWCLGSQYWGQNPHKSNYKAKFGILLDMVGGKNAIFPKEGTSLEWAPQIVDKLWRSARDKGYGNLFNTQETGPTTDDHLFVNGHRGIPSAAIVEFHVYQMGGYGKFHHTHADNMDVISKKTLQAVGDVVLDVIYNE